ncbi:MAG: CRP-like cAMP-binding protein [Candidatus Latescibacterota bacterium]|jgi:CRP-like cAMP-binding protein
MSKRVEFHLVKVIQKLEIFCDLSQKEALEVLQLCQRRSFLEGEIIWNPGDPGDSMLVLLSGKLHVQNKESKVVGEVLPGCSFGEMACLSGNPRFVGFHVVENSTALLLKRSALRSLISNNPHLYVRILEMTIGILGRRITRNVSDKDSTEVDDSVNLSRW